MAEHNDAERSAILTAAQELQRELRAAAERCTEPAVQALVRDAGDALSIADPSSAAPLTVALVGPRSAGKSTLARALAGRADIAIDSNFGTQAVTAYDWNGVRLVDTPGIHAGNPAQDALTYAALDRAECVIFVITSELFDESLARHFRELAFARQNARRMLLVVNKMGMDSGSIESKRSEIEKVTAPLSLADFRSVFVDARAFLEAQRASGVEHDELLRIANVDALVRALDGIVAERRATKQLMGPLFTLRGVSERAASVLSSDTPEERCAVELLQRKRGLLLASRARAKVFVGGVVARAVGDIGRYGDEVAETIERGKTAKDVEARHAAAQTQAQKRSAALSEEARRGVAGELTELRRQLDALHESLLAVELREHFDSPTSAWSLAAKCSSSSWTSHAPMEPLADQTARSEKARDVAKQLGSFAARWAESPAADATRTPAARASNGQKNTYNVGKFFGAQFQPWAAPKVARAIGNVGRSIPVVGSMLAVVAHIGDERQQERSRAQLRDSRGSVRAAYRDAAQAVQAACSDQLEAFLRDFYDSEFTALDEQLQALSPKRAERSAALRTFQSLAQRSTKLIDRAQTASSRRAPSD